MTKKIDIVGMKFNHLTVIEDIGGGKVICQCDCKDKTILECYKRNVKSGSRKSCGCVSPIKNVGNYEGQQFGNWIIIEELGNGKVLCECQCSNKTRRELYKKAVLNGQTKSCGCLRKQNCNATKEKTGANKSKYENQQFGEWTVIKRIVNTPKVLCRCSCGVEKEVYIQHLLDGSARSCGHDRVGNMVGKYYNNWHILKDLGNGLVECECKCSMGVKHIRYKATILYGHSTSCGCNSQNKTRETLMDRYGDICTLKVNNPRSDWQITTLNDKSAFEEYMNSFNTKPYVTQLSEELGVTKSVVIRKLHEYDLYDKVQTMNNKSYMELNMYRLIRDNCKCSVLTNVRDVIDNYELDIYIPELKIAFEFNGSYWHSDKFKDNTYHQQKTIACLSNGIRLVHIFEYEWVNNRNNIQKFILNTINNRKHIIYARSLEIIECSNEDAMSFLNENSITSIESNINIALVDTAHNIIGILGINKRQDRGNREDGVYEVASICYKYNTCVTGGSQKLFEYFKYTYNPLKVYAACGLAKFTGFVYDRLGFKVECITEPQYIWCDNHNNVFINSQLCNEYTNSENKLVKIYDSGDIKFSWHRDVNHKSERK